jgi:hypothetical protein
MVVQQPWWRPAAPSSQGASAGRAALAAEGAGRRLPSRHARARPVTPGQPGFVVRLCWLGMCGTDLRAAAGVLLAMCSAAPVAPTAAHSWVCMAQACRPLTPCGATCHTGVSTRQQGLALSCLQWGMGRNPVSLCIVWSAQQLASPLLEVCGSMPSSCGRVCSTRLLLPGGAMEPCAPGGAGRASCGATALQHMAQRWWGGVGVPPAQHIQVGGGCGVHDGTGCSWRISWVHPPSQAAQVPRRRRALAGVVYPHPPTTHMGD